MVKTKSKPNQIWFSLNEVIEDSNCAFWRKFCDYNLKNNNFMAKMAALSLKVPSPYFFSAGDHNFLIANPVLQEK